MKKNGAIQKLRTVVRGVLLISLGVFVTILAPEKAYAVLPSEQYKLWNLGVTKFDVEVCSAVPQGMNFVTIIPDPNMPPLIPWRSGLSENYIIEQYAIQLLKALAVYMKVPEQNTVTPEHVLALVAFAKAEGGDTTNNSIFNLYNSSYPVNKSDPAYPLLQTRTDYAGRQSYISFDAGVEAIARDWSGTIPGFPNHSRLGAVLQDPSSSAEAFMFALAHWKDYPGNTIWAALSDPEYNGWDNHGALTADGTAELPIGQTQPDAMNAYYKYQLRHITSTRANYASYASIIIGKPQYEANENMRDPSKLVYSFATDTSKPTMQFGSMASSGIGSFTCGNTQALSATVSAGGIVKKAVELAWPKPHVEPLEPKPEYTAALRQFNPDTLTNKTYNNGADCGTYVATVMRASGADPNYPQHGTKIQLDYVLNTKDKYETWTYTKGMQLMPGDILVKNDPNGGDHHTWIYIGPQANGYDRADASQGKRMPNLNISVGSSSLYDGLYSGYTVARLKTGSPTLMQ